MKTITLMIAICIMACLAQKSFAGSQTTGLYLTAEDYTTHKLSYETNGSDGNSIKLNQFMNAARVVVLHDGKKQSFAKSEIFGYHYNNQDYRFFNNIAYKIIDSKDFYLYSAPKLVQEGKWSKAMDNYYFSSTATAEIQPLSIKNLQTVYAANAKFRYLLEADFATDRALTTYDPAVKEYKVKYLYEQSASL